MKQLIYIIMFFWFEMDTIKWIDNWDMDNEMNDDNEIKWQWNEYEWNYW